MCHSECIFCSFFISYFRTILSYYLLGVLQESWLPSCFRGNVGGNIYLTLMLGTRFPFHTQIKDILLGIYRRGQNLFLDILWHNRIIVVTFNQNKIRIIFGGRGSTVILGNHPPSPHASNIQNARTNWVINRISIGTYFLANWLVWFFFISVSYLSNYFVL